MIFSFSLRRARVAVTTLYAFENDIIRKLNEPRVHFALNCSAISCPALPRVPFTAADLNSELDRETRQFFARPHNLLIDAATRTACCNEILKFYTEDFTPAHASSLMAYVRSTHRLRFQPITRWRSHRTTGRLRTVSDSSTRYFFSHGRQKSTRRKPFLGDQLFRQSCIPFGLRARLCNYRLRP